MENWELRRLPLEELNAAAAAAAAAEANWLTDFRIISLTHSIAKLVSTGQ